ncbi:MAG: helix-turn-helix transcriptional regulator [Bdellovibrionota bacterium]
MKRSIKALTISSNHFVRRCLKESLQLAQREVRVLQATGWRDALSLVERNRDIDAIFVYSLIPVQEVETLRNGIRERAPEAHPIFIIALHPSHLERTYVSQKLLEGFEGFIREPFSADEVNEIINVVLEKRQNSTEKECGSLKILQFLVKDALSLLDHAAFERFQQNNKGGGFAFRKMRFLKDKLFSFEISANEEQLLRMLETEVEIQSEYLDLTKFERKKKKVRYAEHPGKVITRIIESRNLTEERLCQMLSSDTEHVLKVLQEEEGLTPELATQLSRVLGKPTDYWISLQSAYEKYQQFRNSQL